MQAVSRKSVILLMFGIRLIGPESWFHVAATQKGAVNAISGIGGIARSGTVDRDVSTVIEIEFERIRDRRHEEVWTCASDIIFPIGQFLVTDPDPFLLNGACCHIPDDLLARIA